MSRAEVDSATFFGKRAGRYDDAYDTRSADGYALQARLDTVVSLAGHGPGSALDCGMGPGRLAAALASRGWTVSGIDASADMVDAAKRRLPDAAGRFAVARIESLPFDDGCFDLVTATGVLEYADVPAALAEIVRVVRRGGRVVLSYPNPRALYGVWKTRVFYPAVRAAKRVGGAPPAELPRGARPYPPDDFERLVEHAGLRVDAVRATSYLLLPSPLDAALPRAAHAIGATLERRTALPALLATQIVFASTSPLTDADRR